MSDALLKGFSKFEVKTSANPEVVIRGHHGGKPEAPALLLMHGYPQTRVIWHKVAPTLAMSYTLVMPDLRGYGESSKPALDDKSDHSLYSKSNMAADMAKVMESLGHSEYYVVGHDRGGRVAHKLCLNHHKQVKKCMLLDIAPTLAMYEATSSFIATAYWHWFFLIQPSPFPEDAMLGNPDAFARKCLRALPSASKGTGIFGEDAYAEYAALFGDPPTVHGMCEDYRAAYHIDMHEQREDIKQGRKIPVPVRILWGKAGIVGHFDVLAEWERYFEHVDNKSKALESGHYLAEETPDQVTEEILDFCRGV